MGRYTSENRQPQGDPNDIIPNVSKFLFNLAADCNSKAVSFNDIMKDDSSSAEELWKMYHGAREALPYKQRIENLAWRMMGARQTLSPKQGGLVHSPAPEYDTGAHAHTSELTTASAIDDFDYVAHIRKMGQEEEEMSRKRPAPYSPQIAFQSAPLAQSAPAVHSNLSAALRDNLSGPIENHGDSAFSFSLDPLAFEGPNGQDPLETVSMHPHSLPASDLPSNFMSTSLSMGPSSMLNNWDQQGSQHTHLVRQDHSLMSLPDHFDRSPSHTPVSISHSYTSSLATDITAQTSLPHQLQHTNSFTSPTSARKGNEAPGALPSSYGGYFDGWSGGMQPMSIASSHARGSNSVTPVEHPSSLPSVSLYDGISKAKKRPPKKKQAVPTSPAVGSNKTSLDSVSCTNCHTRTTPLWRRNPQGQPLCNACGLFLKLHGVVRPLSLKTDVIKKRQRGTSTTTKKSTAPRDGDDLHPTSHVKEERRKPSTRSLKQTTKDPFSTQPELNSIKELNKSFQFHHMQGRGNQDDRGNPANWDWLRLTL